MKLQYAVIENEQELNGLLWSITEDGSNAREAFKNGVSSDGTVIIPIAYPFVFHEAYIKDGVLLNASISRGEDYEYPS